MKKIIALILAVATLFGVMAMTVSAEEAPEATVCNPGNTVVVTFSLPEEYAEIKSGSVEFNYNEENFDFVSAEWQFKNMLIKNVDAENGNGVFAFSSAKTVSGDAFTLKLKVKTDAVYDVYAATANFKLKNADNTNTEVSVVINLAVEEFVEIDDPTTPLDFETATAAIREGDSSEANFAAIKNALEIYSALTAAEKAEASETYQQLVNMINDYNSAAGDANDTVMSVIETAFSAIVDLFTYVSELFVALFDYIFN